MQDYIKEISSFVHNCILDLTDGKEFEEIVSSTPPSAEMGDIAFPMFSLAKLLKKSPVVIAQELAQLINEKGNYKCLNAGAYVNLFFNYDDLAKKIIDKVLNTENYGDTDKFKDEKIMIEFSCPNTNKPLHLGHLRNDSLGESVSRILKANGAEVCKVNLINNRGIHICKSMLAYKEFGEGKTPESENIKSDHFVGDYYVKFNDWSKTDENAEVRAREMLVKWENKDKEVLELWETMNNWTISGINETYKKTGISFDKVYYESETYLMGKDEVQKGLKDGVFYKEDDGSIWIDLSEINLDKKVLLRGDGTSLYITQDLGTAISRFKDWPFERLMYVVASEQKYHFKVLFYILDKLGYKWAKKLYHLSYGMVNLPDGKMKSREGTVVDADDLFDNLSSLAKEEIISKGRDSEIDDLDATSDAIALSALNYYLLSVTPTKDMIFNPKESIAFNGNTGPYMQYMGTRIASILEKYENKKDDFKEAKFDASLLNTTEEKTLIKNILEYPDKVALAGEERSPAVITNFLYDTCKTFSKFYHDSPILNSDDKNVAYSRIQLCKAVLKVLKHSYNLIGIPFLSKM